MAKRAKSGGAAKPVPLPLSAKFRLAGSPLTLNTIGSPSGSVALTLNDKSSW